mmetsp:Transcript_15876/g.26231  ORF Transcript_15876/g.26231 Transcript_15876/m.26231 type:complete len:115 (-) Transcript_15876:184-528(-)
MASFVSVGSSALLSGQRSFSGSFSTRKCRRELAARHSFSIDASLEEGTKVRVSESVTVFHSPEAKNAALDLKGKEGVVVKVIDDAKLSANLPVVVEFSPKFRAHFREDELEALP